MIVLVDTSVWVAHFRGVVGGLVHLLENGRVVIHPVVIGELATGNLRNRKETLRQLLALPRVKTETYEECLTFIESQCLYGRGIGWNDIQLLVSAKLSVALLWTLDKRLNKITHDLRIAYE